MKRFSILVAVAALAMTACSKSETEEVAPAAQTKAIGFESLVNKSSRALDNDNFRTFYVYGSYRKNLRNTQVFNAKPVTKQDDGTWTYDGTRYWVTDASYKFFAYSFDNAQVSANYTHPELDDFGMLTIPQFKVEDGAHQGDLIYAQSEECKYAEGDTPAKVAFSFSHMLSRLCFNLKNGYPEKTTITVSNVQVINVRNLGTCKNGEWTILERPEGEEPIVTAKFAADKNILNDETKEVVTEFAYVLPHNYTQAGGSVRIRFRISAVNENGQLVSDSYVQTSLPDAKWEKGFTYRYSATLTPATVGQHPIEFDVTTIENWGDTTTSLPDLQPTN